MGAIVECSLPYVDSYEDRHKKRRYYFRRSRGAKRVALPGKPGSPEFVAAYNAALTAPAPAREVRAASGTMDALRETYYMSAEFQNLAETTRRETRYVIDALCSTANKEGGKRGDNPVAKLERRHILAWRDRLAKKPGAANKMLRIVKAWLSFAVARQLRNDNPAFGIKPLKVGRIRAWTDDELAAFEARWPLGSFERTGYALALYTAQRRGDVIKMKWSQIAGNAVQVRQKKTGTDLSIHLHPALREALAQASRMGETILTGMRGRALNAVSFGHRMARAIEAAGLPDECVLHGLRKTAARIVAEIGGSVASVTGHLSAQMERQYSRDAAQKRMAKDTIIKWSKRRNGK